MPDPTDWSEVVHVMSVLKWQGRLSPVKDFCDWVADREALDKLMRNM